MSRPGRRASACRNPCRIGGTVRQRTLQVQSPAGLVRSQGPFYGPEQPSRAHRPASIPIRRFCLTPPSRRYPAMRGSQATGAGDESPGKRNCARAWPSWRSWPRSPGARATATRSWSGSGDLYGLALTESTVYPVLTRLARDGSLAVRTEASPCGPDPALLSADRRGPGPPGPDGGELEDGLPFPRRLLEGANP